MLSYWSPICCHKRLTVLRACMAVGITRMGGPSACCYLETFPRSPGSFPLLFSALLASVFFLTCLERSTHLVVIVEHEAIHQHCLKNCFVLDTDIKINVFRFQFCSFAFPARSRAQKKRPGARCNATSRTARLLRQQSSRTNTSNWIVHQAHPGLNTFCPRLFRTRN